MTRFFEFDILPGQQLTEEQANEVERGFQAAKITYKKFEAIPVYFYQVTAHGDDELTKLLKLLREHGFEADYQEVQWTKVEVDEDE